MVVRGYFPPPDHLHWLVDRIPQADVALIHLPGMHSATLREPGPQPIAASLVEVGRGLFPGRTIILCALSAGTLPSLLACAAAPTLFASAILVEPFLNPARNAGLIELVDRFTPAGTSGNPWSRQLFSLDGEQPDYLDAARSLPDPTFVLTGDQANAANGLPTLTPADELEALRALPQVNARLAPGRGHDVAIDGESVFVRTVEEAVRRAAAVAATVR